MDFQYKYMVCTRCFTYNQAPYIEDAMRGFTMQETSFQVVSVIVDDASTDGEPEVIRKFLAEHFEKPFREEEKEYASIICAQHKKNSNCQFVVFLLKYNHYSIKKSKLAYLEEWLGNAKYLALCEGDDYWINSLKLQKQVDFLENNPTYSGVFGNRIKYYEREGKKVIHKYCKSDWTTSDMMSGNLIGVQNLMFRKDIDDIPLESNSNGDMIINYKCTVWGKLKYVDENFAVYRLSGKGLSSSLSKDKSIETVYKHWYDFHRETGFKFNRELTKLFTRWFLGGTFVEHNFKMHYNCIRKYHAPDNNRFFWYVIYGVCDVCRALKHRLVGNGDVEVVVK